MQQELIEMLDKMVKYFDEISSDSYYYRETASILNEAEKLVEKAKNSAKEPAVPQGFATLNEWFLSLPEQRQAQLREDKWMLAGAAFEAGQARAPAVPQGDLASVTEIETVIDWCVTSYMPMPSNEHAALLVDRLRHLRATPAAPSPPVTCGNGCSCLVQCGDTYAHAGLPSPKEPVALTDSYAGVIAWIGDKQCKRVLTEGAIKKEHTPGVAMRNTAHQCVQEVIIAALREKEQAT